MPLQVELVSPERILYSGEAEMVVCRTTSGGEIAFLTGHVPFLGGMATGVVRIHLEGGQVERAAVREGFVEMRDDRVIILSDEAELADQVDVERARRDKEEAQGRQGEDDDAAAGRLRWAEVRLELAEAS